MHLSHVRERRVFGVGVDDSAVGMIFDVIFGRAQINAGVATGTLSGFGFAAFVRPRRGLILTRPLIGLRWLLGESASSEREGYEDNGKKRPHVSILSRSDSKRR